jgi:hypothetical protein
MLLGDLGVVRSVNNHLMRDHVFVFRHATGLISLSHPERSWDVESISTATILVELLIPGAKITLEAE